LAHRPTVPVLLAWLALAAACQTPSQHQSPAPAAPTGRAPLFAPADLELLDAPGRDEWQQPDRVMDELGIAEASRVADVGAGSGWFTARLAHRVGPNGRVFAEDIQEPMIDAIRRRVEREDLTNVELILGASADPHLPADLRAVLVVNAYAEFDQPVQMLARIAAALSPTGRLGIVDFKTDGDGGPGPPLAHRVTEDAIIRDAGAAGLTLHGRPAFLRYQYLLVFGIKN
jgi:predicted methyltransferase